MQILADIPFLVGVSAFFVFVFMIEISLYFLRYEFSHLFGRNFLVSSHAGTRLPCVFLYHKVFEKICQGLA